MKEKEMNQLWLVTDDALRIKISEYEEEFKTTLTEENVKHFLELYYYLIKGSLTERHEKELLRIKRLMESDFEVVDTVLPEITAPVNCITSEGGYIIHPFPEIDLQQLTLILDTTITHDQISKQVGFLMSVLTFTRKDQQNVGFNSPSATGKSYIALELMKYFPQDSIILLAYVSPQAFFHEDGRLVTTDGIPIKSRNQYINDGIKEWEQENPRPEEGVTDWREARASRIRLLRVKWDSIEKIYQVDLERKILVFIDAPHDLLLQRLRPMLSHDQKIIQVKITDKTTTGSNRTKTVELIGFPTVLFLTTRFSAEEQERNRMFLLSAEVSQSKLEDSIKMSSIRLSNDEAFSLRMDEDPERIELKNRVMAISRAGIDEILMKEEDREYVVSRFLREHPKLAPRQQRDFPRLIALIKAHALLNLWTRERDDNKIWVSHIDVEAGYQLYSKISESNELGIPPLIYKFWTEALKPQLDESIKEIDGVEVPAGLSRKEISKLYYQTFNSRIGTKGLKHIIDILIDTGLIIDEPDPNDKRFFRVYACDNGTDDTDHICENEIIYPPQLVIQKTEGVEKEQDSDFLEQFRTLACSFAGENARSVGGYWWDWKQRPWGGCGSWKLEETGEAGQ